MYKDWKKSIPQLGRQTENHKTCHSWLLELLPGSGVWWERCPLPHTSVFVANADMMRRSLPQRGRLCRTRLRQQRRVRCSRQLWKQELHTVGSERGGMTRTWGPPLGTKTDRDLWLMASEERWGMQSCNCKELNSVNNHVSLEVDSTPELWSLMRTWAENTSKSTWTSA